MKQLYLKGILLCLCLLASIKVFSYDAKIDGIYYNFNGDEVIVTYQKGQDWGPISDYSGSVVIPSTVTYNGKTYTVTSIGIGAFYNCTSLTSITIPNSVTAIGSSAFEGCRGLTSVTLGNSVTAIGYSAFKDCTSLTTVTIPNSVTSIGSSAFSGCTGLISITIPNSVTSIGDSAFSGTPWYNNQPNGLVYAGKIAYKYKGTMPQNTQIIIEEGTLGISDYAFSGCKSLTSVTIPNSVTSIGGGAFYNCTGLTSITIPNSVTSIGYNAFRDCSGLTTVTIGNSVTSIGDYAFSGCKSLTSVTIPNSVTSIGEGAFYSCSGLTTVTIPNSVTSIGNSAFAYCSSLTSINIPNSVTSIGSSAFKRCENLTSVTIPDGVTSIGEEVFWNCYRLTSVTLGNGVTSIGSSAFESCSRLKSITIPNSVTSIGDSAFSGCKSLTSVTIPNSVTSIGKYAFSYCSGLTTIIIGNGVTSIGEKAFDSCYIKRDLFINYSSLTSDDNWGATLYDEETTEGLLIADNIVVKYRGQAGSVTIPDGVTSIGDYAFSKCPGLTSVTIPNSVTSIGEGAFHECSGLTSVTIPNSVTSIGNSAFSGCKSLTSIIIPESVTSIDNSTFSGCKSLTSITIPESVTSIGNSAFSSCSGLTSINIPNSVTSIGNSAFSGCSGLTSITIPESVTSIGGSAFYECSSLTSINILDGVTSIGEYTFQNCSSLTSVIIPGSVTSLGKEVFRDCSGLTSVTIEDGMKFIGNRAFRSCSNLTSITIPESVINIGYEAFDRTPWYNSLPDGVVYAGNVAYAYKGSMPAGTSIVLKEGTTGITTEAFQLKKSITSLVIPNSVRYIGSNAFNGCKGLTSVTIPGSVQDCGSGIFSDCSGLTSVIIEDGVTSISDGSFYSCSNLTTITIPESVTSIGGMAFSGTPWYNNQPDGLVYAGKVAYKYKGTMPEGTEIAIKEGTAGIAAAAFSGCTGLTSISIPNSVTNIGINAFANTAWYDNQPDNSLIYAGKVAYQYKTTSVPITPGMDVTQDVIQLQIQINEGTFGIADGAFQNCNGLISVNIPNSMKSIGNSAFSGCSGLTSINIPNNVTRIGNSAFSGCSGLTSITLGNSLTNINWNTFTGIPAKFYIKDKSITLVSLWNAGYKSNIYDVETKNRIEPFNPVSGITSSSVRFNKFIDVDGASKLSEKLSFNNEEVEGLSVLGLEPDTEVSVKYSVNLQYGNKKITYEKAEKAKTEELILTTQQPRVISDGSVIVAATSNLDDEETNVGFEWRRNDWTDDFDSKTGGAYLYGGTMEGYIRSINSNYLWKFRPFYTSNTGNTYYGEWKGMDPSDYSYFEPIVYTYAAITLTGTDTGVNAEIKGYAMRGTDKITSQGFMYWKGSAPSSSRMKATSIPSGAKTIEASGNVMTTILEDLDYDTQYCYVAFVKTEENETFLGEVQTFYMDTPDGIESIKTDVEATEVARYDLQGRKIDKPQKGINIIRYSDGTTRKVVIK